MADTTSQCMIRIKQLENPADKKHPSHNKSFWAYVDAELDYIRKVFKPDNDTEEAKADSQCRTTW